MDALIGDSTADAAELPNMGDIWGMLGMSDQDVNLVNRLKEAESLVEAGKLKPEVYEELVKATMRQIATDGTHHTSKSSGFWGKFRQSARRVVSSRLTGGPRAHIASKGELQQKIQEKMREYENNRPMLKKPIMEGFLHVHDKESDAVYHKVTMARARNLLKDHRDGVEISDDEQSGWKRRYFILYRNCLRCYKITEKEYERYAKDGSNSIASKLQGMEPHSFVVLTPDSFVAEADDKKVDIDDSDDSDSDYTDGGAGFLSNDSLGLRNHSFYLSDLKSQLLVAAETEELKHYWMHTIATVLKKLRTDVAYFEAPLFLDRQVISAEEAKKQMEDRLRKYEESKVSLQKRKEQEAREAAEKRERTRAAEEELIAKAKREVRLINITKEMRAERIKDRKSAKKQKKKKKKQKGYVTDTETSSKKLTRRKFSSPTSVLFGRRKSKAAVVKGSGAGSIRRLSVQSDNTSAHLDSFIDSDDDSIFGSSTFDSQRSTIMHLSEFEDSDDESDEQLEAIRRTAATWKLRAEEAAKKAEKHRAQLESHRKEQLEAQQILNETVEALKQKSREAEARIIAERDAVLKKLESGKYRRKSMADGGDLKPEELKKLEKERKALRTKLAALQSALAVNLDELEWDGTLEDAEEKMKSLVPKLCSDDPTIQREAEAEFENWDKIVRNHADYKARELKKMQDWEASNKGKNEEAFKKMRELVPPNISDLTIEKLKKQSKGKLTHSGAKRILSTQIFRFLYMDKDTISKVHVADLSSRYIPQGLDILELRAVYFCLPDEFQNDRDGRKKVWLENLRSKLMNLTELEEKGQLSESQKQNYAYRAAGDAPKVKLGPPRGKGLRAKQKGLKGKLQASRGKPRPGGPGKIDTSALQAALAGKLADLQSGGPPPPTKKAAGEGSGSPGPLGRVPPQVLASRRAVEGDGGGPLGLPFGRQIPAAVLASRRMQEEQEEATAAQSRDAAPPKESTMNGFARSFLSELAEGYQNLTGDALGSDKKEEEVTEAKVQDESPQISEQKKSGFMAALASSLEPSAEAAAVPEKKQKGKKGKKSKKGKKAPKRGTLKHAESATMYSRRSVLDDDMDLLLNGSSRPRKKSVLQRPTRKKSIFQARPQGNERTVEAEIESQIEDLILTIRKHGAARDPRENGAVTITYGDLNILSNNSEKLTGLLLQAKKKNRVVYDGDLLFDKSHNKVKVTVVF